MVAHICVVASTSHTELKINSLTNELLYPKTFSVSFNAVLDFELTVSSLRLTV